MDRVSQLRPFIVFFLFVPDIYRFFNQLWLISRWKLSMRCLHVLLKFPLVSSELSSFLPLRTLNTLSLLGWVSVCQDPAKCGNVCM